MKLGYPSWSGFSPYSRILGGDPLATSKSFSKKIIWVPRICNTECFEILIDSEFWVFYLWNILLHFDCQNYFVKLLSRQEQTYSLLSQNNSQNLRCNSRKLILKWSSFWRKDPSEAFSFWQPWRFNHSSYRLCSKK